MRIRIITMEDPLYTLDFVGDIIRARHVDITGITIASGGRLTIGRNRSRLGYLGALFLIMGPAFFLQNTSRTLLFSTRKKISRLLTFLPSPGLDAISRRYGITVDRTDDPNSDRFVKKISEEKPDVIINQSQFILRKPLLDAARLGALNRHNALLPRNRGRLTPFWVLFKGEEETGVSIHLLNERIDAGPILVQKRFSVTREDTFRSIVDKNYALAPGAMLEALDMLEKGRTSIIENDPGKGTYNSIPTLGQAWKYRKDRIRRRFSRRQAG